MLKDKIHLRLEDLPLLENLEDKISTDICGSACETYSSYYGWHTYFPGEFVEFWDELGYYKEYVCTEFYPEDIWVPA